MRLPECLEHTSDSLLAIRGGCVVAHRSGREPSSGILIGTKGSVASDMSWGILAGFGIGVAVLAMIAVIAGTLRFLSDRDVRKIASAYPDAFVIAGVASEEMVATVRQRAVLLDATWPQDLGTGFVMTVDPSAITFWAEPDWRLARLDTAHVRSIEFDEIEAGGSLLNGLRIHSVVNGESVDLAMFMMNGATLGIFPATKARILGIAETASRAAGLAATGRATAESP